MELLGKEYLTEHCLQEYSDRAEEDAFRTYSSELLRVVANGMISLGGGEQITKSWHDLKNYKPETRSPEEIKDQILSGLKKC